MINTLKMSLKIDISYAVNSFIYVLRHFIIFKDLITDDAYKSKNLKKIVGIIGVVLSLIRSLLFKLFYFIVIYYICTIICPNNLLDTFIHIYIIFSIIGLFINNKLLITDRKKYTSIILFNMDAFCYMKAIFWWNIFMCLIFNSLSFLIFKDLIGYSFITAFCLVLFSLCTRTVGEAFNVWFYKKNKYLWHNNTMVYFSLLLFLLVICCFPFFNVFISNWLLVLLVFFIVLSLISINYLYKVCDYKLIFKRLNTKVKVMNSNSRSDYSRQEMVKVRDKDKVINSRKIKGKKGYDLFNTIFFERHRQILYRSAFKYTLGIIVIIVFIGILAVNYSDVKIYTLDFLNNHLAFFVIIMYFINRGSVVTQAMFYNCDHAMLCYNFYRKKDVLLNLFQKRLITIIKVNLLPAIVMSFGILVLLVILGANFSINYIMIPLFIIVLSVFFSVHYLAIYYLLQPYNKDMQIKKVSYSVVSLIVYLIAYSIKDVVMSSLLFSVIGIFSTLIYIVVSLFLVYKNSPYTFKLN